MYKLFIRPILDVILKLSYRTIFLLGIVSLILTAAICYELDSESWSIAFAMTGGFLTGAILCSMLPRYVKLEAEKLALDLEAKSTLDNLNLNNKNLLAKVEQLERMKVNVSAYQPMMKLGLLQLDMDLTDFSQITLNESEGKWAKLKPALKEEYVGVLKVKFKANLGVDLDKLRFKEDQQGKLIVSGLCSEYQGMIDDREDWLLHEIRKDTVGKALLKMKEKRQYVIEDIKEDLMLLTDQQRKALKERINKGFHFENVLQHTEKMAEEVIRLVLAPLRKEIIFRKDSDSSGHGFLAYLDFHNIKVDSEIKELQLSNRG